MRDGDLFAEVRGRTLRKRAEIEGLRRLLDQADREMQGICSRLHEIALTAPPDVRAEIMDLIEKVRTGKHDRCR